MLTSISILWYDIPSGVTLPTDINESDFRPLQPEVYDDFPTEESNASKIPHIFHQTYIDEMIPESYVKYVQSVLKYNPNWTYYLWTDKSARELIANKYPYLLSTWDNYKSGINRGDALRYVVLYEFGGVYLDLDYEIFRSFDRVTMKYACIFPPEPLEQAIFRMNTFLINNAIMMCRPKHPFLKQMLNSLPVFRSMADQIDVAGPCFVTHQFLVYNNISGDEMRSEKTDESSNSPYFYKGKLLEDGFDSVYIPNTRYFMDTLDDHIFSEYKYYRLCNGFKTLNLLTQRACVDLKRRGFKRKPSKYVFAKHHWGQTYAASTKRLAWIKSWFVKPYYNITEIVPHAKIYKDSIHSTT